MSSAPPRWLQGSRQIVEKRVGWLLLSVFVLGSVGVYTYLGHVSDQLVAAAALGEARRYSRALEEFRTLYTSEVVANARDAGVVVSHDYAHRTGAIPLPATLSMLLGSQLTGSGGAGEARLYSDHPFPWRAEESVLDEFEVEALAALRLEPSEPYYQFEERNGAYVLRYATADTMREACIGCHNSHPESPKIDWAVGDVRGVLEIITPLDDAAAQTSSGVRSLAMLFLAVGLTGLGAGYLVIVRLRRDGAALQTSNERLETERGRAEDASEAKGQFLAHMSHEIRTPLNAVIGMSGILEETKLDREQEDLVHTVHTSGVALLSIINDILDFSKIEAGQVDLENLPLALDDCAGDAIDLVALDAHEKGLVLSYSRAEDVPPWITGDVTRLRQILLNLLNNAIKFTTDGEIALTIDASSARGGQTRLHVRVRDTGPGIPPEGLKRLFQSFSQVDASTTRKHGGTGLGLVISKRFAELMGGEMWAESEVGRGSVFHFTIVVPVTKAPVDADDRGVTHPTPAREPASVRILLTEDNLVNQKVALKMLERLGYHADIACNGVEALARVQRVDYDIILMDLQMPEMDGLEATERIRAGTSPTRPWIIAMTANASKQDRKACLDAGMNEFLTKPVTMRSLEGALLSVPETTEEHRAPTNGSMGEAPKP